MSWADAWGPALDAVESPNLVMTSVGRSALRRSQLSCLFLAFTVAASLGLANVPQGQALEIRARPDLGVVSDASPDRGRGAISGVVSDAETGAPVPGALVELAPGVGAPSSARVLTDSRGRFVFSRLGPAEGYVLKAFGDGYQESPFSSVQRNQGPEQRPTPVPLLTDEWRRDLQIRLWRLGEINGDVLDEFGEPLVGVSVRAFTSTVLHGKSYLAGSALATTDDRGRYRLTALRPGGYLIAVLGPQATVPAYLPESEQRRAIGALVTGAADTGGQPTVNGPAQRFGTGHRLVVTNLSLPTTDGAPRLYPLTFFPSAPSPAAAVSVEVRGSGPVHGVNFQLRPVRGSSVSGTLSTTIAGGAPLLRLLPRGAEGLGLGNEVATTLVEPNGSFTFLGVPPGAYTLVAHSGAMEFVSQSVPGRAPDPAGFIPEPVGIGSFPGMPGLSILERSGPPAAWWGRLPIDVGNEDLTGVILPIRPTLSIAGKIELDDGTEWPSSQSLMFVTAEPADGDPTFGMRRGLVERTGDSWTFNLTGLLPGRYLLRGSYYPMRTVTWAGRDVTEVGIDASASEDVRDVVITLTAKGTELTGRVVNRERVAASELAVIAFPTDETLWVNYGWIPRRLRSARVGADGLFTFRNLPAGAYYVVAVEADRADAWTDPLVLKTLADQAVRATLNWGSATRISVPTATAGRI